MNITLFHKLNRHNIRILKFTSLDVNEFSLDNRLCISFIKFFIQLYNQDVPSISLKFHTRTNHITRRTLNLPLINKAKYHFSYRIWCLKIFNLLISKNYNASDIHICNLYTIYNIINTNNFLHVLFKT